MYIKNNNIESPGKTRLFFIADNGSRKKKTHFQFIIEIIDKLSSTIFCFFRFSQTINDDRVNSASDWSNYYVKTFPYV